MFCEFWHFLHQLFYLLVRLPTLSVRFTIMHFMGWKEIGGKLLNSTILQQNKVRNSFTAVIIFEFDNFSMIYLMKFIW